jgi:transposase
MLLKTILNQCEKYSSFVYGDARLCNQYGNKSWDKDVIVIDIAPRKNSRPICSKCSIKGSCYDHITNRLFEHVPLWGIKVFFAYQMRRVDCKKCGVVVEQVPWSDGKREVTKSFEWFLSEWAKRLSWQETAKVFGVGWATVYRAVNMAVIWGLLHRDLSNVKSIGVDEVAKKKGHNYLTLVYQIDEGQRRLLWVGENREEITLRAFFQYFGKKRCENIEAVCSDMWKPYMNVIKEKLPSAVHVLDRYHIMSNMGKAIDKVRAEEARKMQQDGFEPVLKKSRFVFLKRSENLTKHQRGKLSELLQYNLKSVRAYLLKEDFQNFWNYKSKAWAGKFLDSWCTQVMRSKIEPMKDVAKSIRKHKTLILNWFEMKGEISAGIVEGFNTKAKLTARKSFGFRTYSVHRVALLHQLGALPIPDFTHRYF